MIITTGDEEVDRQNINLISENIYGKAFQLHQVSHEYLDKCHKTLEQKIKEEKIIEKRERLIESKDNIAIQLEQHSRDPPTRQDVISLLTDLRKTFLDEVANGKSREEVSDDMGTKILENGIKGAKATGLTLKSANLAI